MKDRLYMKMKFSFDRHLSDQYMDDFGADSVCLSRECYVTATISKARGCTRRKSQTPSLHVQGSCFMHGVHETHLSKNTQKNIVDSKRETQKHSCLIFKHDDLRRYVHFTYSIANRTRLETLVHHQLIVIIQFLSGRH